MLWLAAAAALLGLALATLWLTLLVVLWQLPVMAVLTPRARHLSWALLAAAPPEAARRWEGLPDALLATIAENLEPGDVG